MTRITGFLDFVCHPLFCKTPKNTTFWKMDLFLSSGERWKTSALLGPFSRLHPPPSPEDGNIQFPKLMMDKVQKPSNSQYYTPLELFRIYLLDDV
jgi:hypothetical protein